MKKSKSCLKAVVIVITVVFAASCQSVPQPPEMESSVQLLPESSDVIIRAEVDANRELIEPVLALFSDIPPKLKEEFLDRTETVWAGLDFDTKAPMDDSWLPKPAFNSSIVAKGDFPASMIKWGLCWDSGWKKLNYKPLPEEKIKLPYWHEKEGLNQISLPDDSYLLASSGSIEEMIGHWSSQMSAAVSREWMDYEQFSDITIMTRNLSQEDYAIFIPQFSRVPLESLIISLKRAGDEYNISGRFHMDSEVSAFLFSALFRTMVITAKKEDGSKLFASPKNIVIKKEGSDVVLEGMLLTTSNILTVESGWLAAAGMK